MKRLVALFCFVTLLVLGTSAFAQRFLPTHTAPNVTNVAPTIVLLVNLSRNYLRLQNDSGNDFYCSFAVAAAINTGIRVLANGGVVEFSYKVPPSSVSCIAVAGAVNNLLVLEGTVTP